MNWFKKWWFSLLCYGLALFITIYATVYLFIDDYAFVMITHITSGILVPAILLIIIAGISSPRKDKKDE